MNVPDVLVKAIEFKNLNLDDIIAFLEKHEKTQIVNMMCVFGEKHVLHSVFQTLKAFANHENITRNESLEFLVRLSGSRQITKAIKASGAQQQSVFVCWDKNTDDVFNEFKKRFPFREIPLRKVPLDEEMDAIEKSATFWLG